MKRILLGALTFLTLSILSFSYNWDTYNYDYYINVTNVSKSIFTVTMSNPNSQGASFIHYTNENSLDCGYTYVKYPHETSFSGVGTVTLTVLPGQNFSFGAHAYLDNDDMYTGQLVITFVNDNDGTSRVFDAHGANYYDADITKAGVMVPNQGFDWIKSMTRNPDSSNYLLWGPDSDIEIVIP